MFKKMFEEWCCFALRAEDGAAGADGGSTEAESEIEGDTKSEDNKTVDNQSLEDANKTKEGDTNKGLSSSKKAELPNKDIEQDAKAEEKQEIKPESYGDFDLQGLDVDEKLMTSFKALAASKKLSKEDAQEFVNMQISSIKAIDEGHKKQIEAWQGQNAKTYGDNLQEKEAQAIKGLDRFDTKGNLKSLLQATGLIFNPSVVSFLITLDESVSEKPFIKGAVGGAGNETWAETLHPEIK